MCCFVWELRRQIWRRSFLVLVGVEPLAVAAVVVAEAGCSNSECSETMDLQHAAVAKAAADTAAVVQASD